MRALAEAASRRLPQPVVVENRPGAGSTLGPAAVARSRPDGHLLPQLPASAVRVQILQGLPWDPLRDFTPILHVTGYAFAATCARPRPGALGGTSWRRRGGGRGR